MQAAVLTVQKRMSHYDGSFVQFRCDEKGFLAVSAFGLPGKSHEDGPSRGVKAALSIVAAMRELQQVSWVSLPESQHIWMRWVPGGSLCEGWHHAISWQSVIHLLLC